MKDLITSIASLFLLMLFVMQFAGSQVTHTRLFQADMAVESFRDTMKEEGCMTSGNQARVTANLADICGCEADEIVVTADDGGIPQPEGSHLHYRIGFPLQNLIVMASSLGIGEAENAAWIELEGWVVSQYEEPDYNDGDSASNDDGNSV